MGSAVLVQGGRRLFRVGAEGRVEAETVLAATPEEFARQWVEGFPDGAPPEAIAMVRRAPALAVVDPRVSVMLVGHGVRLAPAALSLARSAREVVPWEDPGERELLLRIARAALARELASPEQTLIALAREEIRIERTERREVEARGHWLAGDEGALAEYGRSWEPLIASVRRHHNALEERLREAVRALAPNLAEVVGDRIAARLIAEAGGLQPLARMTASRLQLLGAKRRPSGGRGPQHGVIFGALRMTEVPPGRSGAYSRTLAALAVIAARADAFTRADIYPDLVARRDRRVEALKRSHA